MLPKQLTEPLERDAVGVHPTTSSDVMVVMILSHPAALVIVVVLLPTWAGLQVSALTVAVVGWLTLTVAVVVAVQPLAVTVTV